MLSTMYVVSCTKTPFTMIMARMVANNFNGSVIISRRGRTNIFIRVSREPTIIYAARPPVISKYAWKYVARSHTRVIFNTARSSVRAGRERPPSDAIESSVRKFGFAEKTEVSRQQIEVRNQQSALSFEFCQPPSWLLIYVRSE